jgi:cellulose synthase operon protein YhjQ
MGISSDILGLFRKIDVSPEQYQEVSRAGRDQDSVSRWPALATSATPEPQADSPHAAPLPGPTEAKNASSVAPISCASAAPATARHFQDNSEQTAWPAGSLQDLLAQLKQAENEAVANATAKASQEQLIGPVAPALGQVNVVTVMSSKGGVGKSTIAANLAVGLANLGRSVLLVDLDPQNALIHHVQPQNRRSIEDAARGIASTSESIQDWRLLCMATTAGPALLPHGLIEEKERQAFEQLLDRDRYWLGRHLEAMELADGAVVILDTPPGPSPYLRQALAITRQALVVSLPDAASYTALPMAEKLISSYVGERDDFVGCSYLINQVDRSRQLNRDVSLIMQQAVGERLVGMIHRDQSVSDALAYNRTALEQDAHGQGFQDLVRFAQTFMGQLPFASEGSATK